MEESREELARRMYELERDNNRMLRAMRRNSFVGGIFRLLLWVAALGVPVWLYINYLAPVLNQATETLNQVQGQVQQAKDIGAQISVPFSEFSDMFDKLKGYLPSTSGGSVEEQ